MSSKYILKRLDEFEKSRKEFIETSPDTDSTEFQDFYDLLIYTQSVLIGYPGSMIPVNNDSDKEKYKLIVDRLYKLMNAEGLTNVFYESRITDSMYHIISPYIERSMELKPAFINIRYKNDSVIEYYNEAMSAYAHANFNASLVLVNATLEEILSVKLYNHDPGKYNFYNRTGREFKRENTKMANLIDWAEMEGLIDKTQKSILHEIRIKRNDTMHQLEGRKVDDLGKILNQSRDIIEYLYSKDTPSDD